MKSFISVGTILHNYNTSLYIKHRRKSKKKITPKTDVKQNDNLNDPIYKTSNNNWLTFAEFELTYMAMFEITNLTMVRSPPGLDP